MNERREEEMQNLARKAEVARMQQEEERARRERETNEQMAKQRAM